jgi:hypothetical protein
MKVRLFALISIVLALALYRILPHPANFTPVMAVALFAGAKFDDKRMALLLPLLAMLLADLVIGLHETMLFVYGSLALVVALGIAIHRRRGFVAVTAAAVAGSLSFFAITNFGAWLYSPGLYSRDWPGLATAYIAAIPLYHNSLVSDAVFTAILFGSWALAERTFPQLVDSRTV